MRSEQKEQTRLDIEQEIANMLRGGQLVSRAHVIGMYKGRGLAEGSVALLFDQAFDGSAFQQRTGVNLEKIEIAKPGTYRGKRVFLKDKEINLQDTNFKEIYNSLQG